MPRRGMCPSGWGPAAVVADVGLLDRLRWADTEGRLGRSGLVLAGLVVAVGVEDAFLWGGRCPVRYRRLIAESGYSRSTVARRLPAVLALLAEVGGIVYDREVGGAVSGDGWSMGMCWRVGGWGGCRGRRRTARIVCTRRAGRIRTGPPMRCGGAGRDGAVTWQPPSTPTVWPPGQVFALRPCAAGRIRRVCGTIVVTAWRWPAGRIPTSTLTGSRSATTIIAVRCRPGPVRSGPVLRVPRYVGTDTPTSRNPTPPRHLSTNHRMLVSYGVVSSATSPPIQPPRVRNLLVRALRATPRGNKFQQNRRLWDVAHPFGGGEEWTPERRNYETRAASGSWAGPDASWVGSDLARRFGWHVAEQAALEVDRVVRLRRPVRNRQSLATHFARCFARPQLCHRRHQGACGGTRLNQHRGRRLDENLARAASHTATTVPPNRHRYQPRTPLPNLGGRFRSPLQNHGSFDQAQLEAALTRLPAPLATQLARLATRHRIRHSDQ